VSFTAAAELSKMGQTIAIRRSQNVADRSAMFDELEVWLNRGAEKGDVR
jgi:hypothetical protein